MQEKNPRMSGEKSTEKQEQARSVEAACEIFEILPDDAQYITLLDLYNELVDIYIGKGPYAYDKDSRLRHFREMFGKLPEESKYKRPFFVLVYKKASQEINDPMKKDIFEDTLSLIFQNRIGVAKVGQWMCGTCMNRSLGMLGESKEAEEAAAEIFEILPIYFQNDLNWMLYYELRDIYIGNKPREYDEDSRLRRFREMFRKLPEDSKYRRHFLVIGSDKDPYGLTPEEREICQFAMLKLQEMKHRPWARRNFAVSDGCRDKTSASAYNLASPRGNSVASSPYCRSPKEGERNDDLEVITFSPLGGSPKAEEMIKTAEMEEGMREKGPRMLGENSSEKQEQARSVEAACEIFKNFPDDVKHMMISDLYDELRDIYMSKLPYKHDEDSSLRCFKWMFEKLPEDSKHRRHFFAIGSEKEPQELIPEEDEIFGHILRHRNEAAKMGQKICALCMKRSPGMLEVSKETQEQARSAEAPAEIFKNLRYANQDALIGSSGARSKSSASVKKLMNMMKTRGSDVSRTCLGNFQKIQSAGDTSLCLVLTKIPLILNLLQKKVKSAFFALLKPRGHRQRKRTSVKSIPSSSRLPMQGERNDYFKVKSFELRGGSSTQAGTSAGGVSNH